MTGPTAIPHPETSSHHRHPSDLASSAHNNTSHTTPRNNRNSPPLTSPVYARTAFSLPGPISPSSSFRNTANGWTATGVGAQTNGLRSPKAVSSTLPSAQRDYFPETTNGTRHHRAASASSTTSSIDSFGPPTPRSEATPSMAGAPLGRVQSIPLGTSPYESIKGRRNSVVGGNQQLGTGWNGFGALRGARTSDASEHRMPTSAVSSSTTSTSSASSNASAGGMGGLFRKLSLSGGGAPTGGGGAGHHRGYRHDHRSASLSSDTSTVSASSPVEASAPAAVPVAVEQPKMRGRQGSMNGSAKRKPSPHGERLLMGWTHAH